MKKKKFFKALRTIDQLLEQVYGRQLDQMERLAPNKNLRPALKGLFFELNRLVFDLENTTDLRGIEAFLDENSQLLERRIERFNEQRMIAAEIKKSELRRENEQFRTDALRLLQDLDDLEAPLGGNDENDNDDEVEGERVIAESTKVARVAITSVLKLVDQISSTTEGVENAFVTIDREAITKDLKLFRKKRKLRKYSKHIYIFIWAVLVLGALFSALASTIAKVFLTSHWKSLVAFSIAVAAAKHYLLGPWFQARTLALKRKHLTRSLEEFYTANINVTFLIALKDKRIVPTKGVRKRKAQAYRMT